ncbi:MAG: site-2 protease family protein [Actinobacteria bacterium]|nr:site-2 protease family protein [Actinomycetota bacterium]
MSTRIRLGRLFGIPIGVQPAWLLIVALIAWSLGASYYPGQVDGISGPAAYALGLASALLLFAGILLHELGHALVARRRGVGIEEIDLWLLGGVARMSGQPTRAADELAFAGAGPAVTLVITVVCGSLAVALPASAPDALQALLDYLTFVNAAILGLNLLPAFPLDGGRIARALIWLYDGDLRKATITAARLGRGIGWGLIALGVLGVGAGFLAGFWTAIIGVFVIFAAKAEEQATRLRAALSGRRAGSLATPFPGGPLEADRHLRGLDPELLVDEDTDLADLVERPAFLRARRALVRRADGSLGLIALEDAEELARAVELAGNPQPPGRNRADGGDGEPGETRSMLGPGMRKAHR